jgi:hypothetical protein
MSDPLWLVGDKAKLRVQVRAESEGSLIVLFLNGHSYAHV